MTTNRHTHHSLLAKLSLAFLLLVPLHLAVPQVQAQTIPTSYHLSVSPSSAFLKAKPGSTSTHTIAVRNPAAFATTVTVTMVDFVPDGVSGIPQLQSTFSFPYIDNQEQLADSVTIPANSQRNIPISISVPAGSPEREYPITILIRSEPAAEEGTTAIIPTIGSNLVVWVSERDHVDQKLEVVSLQRPKIIDSFRPFSFEPLIENLETMSAVASGSATIKDWRGRVLGSTDIYPEVILGKSSRVIQGAKAAEAVLPTDPAAATATRFEPTDFLFTQPFWLGPYTVQFTFVNPGITGTYTTIQEVTVIALPISLLVILGALAIVLGGSWYWNKKRGVNEY